MDDVQLRILDEFAVIRFRFGNVQLRAHLVSLLGLADAYRTNLDASQPSNGFQMDAADETGPCNRRSKPVPHAITPTRRRLAAP
jgi:hypothetical protein